MSIRTWIENNLIATDPNPQYSDYDHTAGIGHGYIETPNGGHIHQERYNAMATAISEKEAA